MMESAITFKVGGNECLGILHSADNACDTGVLLVVGGPQYRVGSHRQFVQLSRSLAQNAIISMRFDYRGMGDADGEKQTFDSVCDDIQAAVEAFLSAKPELKRVVIWGLCDAASAALMYAHKDPRVEGLVLLNPWLRGASTTGKTMLKHYYVKRLLSKAFWKKLLTGNVAVSNSLKEAKTFASDAMASATDADSDYQKRMLDGFSGFKGKVCCIYSGNDLTAKEFLEYTASDKRWKKLLKGVSRKEFIDEADHTFSSKAFKQRVEQITADFVKSSF